MRGFPAAIGFGFGRRPRPTTPTLSVTTGDGSVTATIDGDAGVTNYLKYKSPSHSSWQDGGSRSGDGDITVSGLSEDVPYIFIAYSMDDTGVASLWSNACLVSFTETSENEFDSLLISAATEMLKEFGEPIKYLPAGGGEREITAIIIREPISPLGGAPHGHGPLTHTKVANNSTAGISSSEVDTGGDKVEIKVKIGQAVQQRPITKILKQDAGMMKLEVR